VSEPAPGIVCASNHGIGCETIRRIGRPSATRHVREQEIAMTAETLWESFKAEGENVAERVKQAIHEGNVRRVVVKQGNRIVAEFPLTAGVVGVVLAPVLAAIGALVAMMNDCTIEVERTETELSVNKDAAPEVPVAVDLPGR